jgi:DNA-binding beta-propeller fold protein YncE
MSGSDRHRGVGRDGVGVGGVRWLLLVWLLVGGVLVLWCGSAGAAVERGRVFGFSFGGAGSGAGGLLAPGGVAVDEATGDVYVVDRGNNRIDRFGPGGEFIAAWGWGVRDGAKEYEVCEQSCKAGIAGSGKGQLHSAEAIAVDNSTDVSDPSRGDVYVVADARAERGHLLKFTASGEPLAQIRQEGVERWEGALDGVGVDGGGRLWVYRGVEAEGVIERFSYAEKNVFEEPGLESSVFCPKQGFAVDVSGGAVYVDHERENREELCPLEEGEAARPVVGAELTVDEDALETTLGAVDPLQTSAIASDASSGDVLLDNVSTVGVFSAAGSLLQRLLLPGATPSGSGVAVDAATQDVYVADSASDQVDVFEPEPPGKPTVGELSAENLTASTAELSAQIDPTGADTHYFFQYGTSDCMSDPGACTDVPAAPGTDIGGGYVGQLAAVELKGLEPSTTYYYRVLASNAEGEAEGADTFGSLTTLPSAGGLLLDARAWEMVSPAEKDGSGIEPLRNEGGLIEASEDGNAITYVANGPIVAEPEGNRAPYPTQAIATRHSSGWSSEQIVTPRTKGEGFIPGEAPEYRFFSPDLSQGLVEPDNQALVEPLEQPPLSPEATEKTMYLRDTATGGYLPLVTPANDTAGTEFGEKLEFAGANPDLSDVVLSSEVPLTAGAGAGLYEWQSGKPLMAVSVLPDGTAALEPALGAESHNVRGAVSSDGTRVFWTGESEVPAGEFTETVRHLYMRDMTTGQTLQVDAAVPPIAEPGEEEGEVGFQAANSEGTKVFFTDTARLTENSSLAPVPGESDNPADLYECEVVEEAGKLACNLSDLTADDSGAESAEVLDIVPGVSDDGSYVYFVANGVLAPGARPGHCVRVSTDESPAGATCNLYVWHAGTITFIAALSDEDGPDWGRSEASIEGGSLPVEPSQNLSDVTARVSPNGEYLAFMSDRSLTGYDNVDDSPAAKGARDEEVYVYDASSKLLVCASCNPSGEQPHGVFDVLKAGEGLGLLVDRRQDWASNPTTASPTAHWLAGSVPGWTPLGISSAAEALRQPRYLSDSGRLFFDSADPLVAAADGDERAESIGGSEVQVGTENVYEYEPNGLGDCANGRGCVGLISSGTSEQESAFVDASTTGGDAFFVTSQPLLAEDHDTNFDLYDARVCTAESPCLTSEVASVQHCETTEVCRPPAPQQLPPTPSGTATFSGPPNEAKGVLGTHEASKPPVSKPLTRAQKLAKALKICRRSHKHSKKKRAACERRAKKAFAPKRPSAPKTTGTRR